MENCGGGDGFWGTAGRAWADEDGEILFVGGDDAMGSADEGGVEGDEVHEHAEPEFLLQEAPGDFQAGPGQMGVEEKFHGIITGLAMDIDATREIGRLGIVHPVIIGEPGIFVGEGYQVAGAGMVESEVLFFG